MCGVFGAVMPGAEPTEAAAIATLGLFALQHRGQESAGVAVSDGEQLMLYKDLVNTRELLEQLRGGRSRLPASTDTELLTALLADEPAADTVEALVQVLPRVRGAFSLVILDQHRVIGVRDPHGFRPLVLGRLPASGSADGST